MPDRQWFVDSTNKKINFGTAFDGSRVAQIDVFRLFLPDGRDASEPRNVERRQFVRAGQAISADVLAQAVDLQDAGAVPGTGGGGSSVKPAPQVPDLMGTIQSRWREDFDGNTIDEAEWDYTVGAGMSVSVANSALSIVGGTTPNSVTTFLSRRVFSPAVRAMIGMTLGNTKQGNQQVVVDFVSVDAAGVPDERNLMGYRWWSTDSASANVAAMVYSNGSSPIGFTNMTLVGNTNVSQVYELEMGPDECWWHNRAINTNAARGASNIRHDNIPNPERLYKMRIRVINLASAPSAATHTFQFLSILDYSEVTAEITASRGGGAPGQAMPVQQVGAPIGSTSVTGTVGLSGGSGHAKVNSAAGTNATLITASTNQVLRGWSLANTTAAWRYVKLFNKATAPVPGTDIPVLVIAIPPNDTTDFSLAQGVTFSTGMGYSITAGPADTDTTAVAAGEVIGSIFR